jgi:hypothetical protein
MASSLSNLQTIQGFINNNGELSTVVNPFTLQTNMGYWVKVSQSCTYTVNEGSEKETLVDRGWNLVGFSREYSITDLVTYFSNIGATLTTVQTFTNNGTGTLSTAVNPTTINKNQGYWVYISSINYDKFIQNALTADSNLDLSTQPYNVSFITAQNVNNSLKFYLYSVDNDTGYKKIELSNFKASDLNSEINATTLNSNDLAKTDGWCGYLAVGSNDITISTTYLFL